MININDELFREIVKTVPTEQLEKLMEDCKSCQPNTDEHKLALIQKIVTKYLPNIKFGVNDDSEDTIEKI